MTVHLNGTDLTELPDAEKRMRARAMWRADPTVTGTDLGDRFAMTDGWGRKQIRAARTGTQPVPKPSPAERADSPQRNTTGTATVPAERKADRPRPAKTTPEPASVPPGVLWVTTAAVLAVALVAAAASFQHMVTLAESVGESRPWLLPISVDGLVVAASMSLLVQRRAGRPGSLLAKLALALGLGASLAANVMAVDPTAVDPVIVRRLVAAWPPCSLAIAYELLLSIRSPRTTE